MLFHIKKYAWNFSDTFSPLLPPQKVDVIYECPSDYTSKGKPLRQFQDCMWVHTSIEAEAEISPTMTDCNNTVMTSSLPNLDASKSELDKLSDRLGKLKPMTSRLPKPEISPKPAHLGICWFYACCIPHKKTQIFSDINGKKICFENFQQKTNSALFF